MLTERRFSLTAPLTDAVAAARRKVRFYSRKCPAGSWHGRCQMRVARQ
jgi:hypothetical protein